MNQAIIAPPIVSKAERLNQLHQYWQATNYIGAAQLYLCDNVLLERPLKVSDIKPRLLGHWGTQPGLNLVYAHLNRLIQDTDAKVLLVVGPGHGAPAILANLYLEGTLGKFDQRYEPGLLGLSNLIRQFLWPYGLPSHLVPGTPGRIQEGGELSYSLSHAFGAALDNPDLLVACVVGDGEAETGPLAAAWHSNKYLNPATSGAVLPILHVNGYKLSGPTIFGRMSNDELTNLFTGYGYQVRIVGGSDPRQVHAAMWQAMNWAHEEIQLIQENARSGMLDGVPAWPMLMEILSKLTCEGYLLTSHVWRQDHNGYTHQVPSFINSLVAKKSSVARAYLPPDANCLLSVTDHCLRSHDYINLIVASKAPQAQWLSMEAAKSHCSRGISVSGPDGWADPRPRDTCKLNILSG